jgi:hypothetical protein
MARTPQKLGRYTADELVSFASRLEKLSQLLRSLAELMQAKKTQEVFATYPRRIGDTMDAARSMESSFAKSFDALLAGNPLTESSVSPRSIRRAEFVEKEIKSIISKGRRSKKGSGK